MDIRECTQCPIDTYGLSDHTTPCVSCGYRRTNGKAGQTSEHSCVTCVGGLCSTGLVVTASATLMVVILSLLRYCVINIPAHPRLPVVKREAFLLGIAKYAMYTALPGALEDTNRMIVALANVGFNVRVFNNTAYGKDLPNVKRDGNVMQLFSEWCSQLQKGCDIIVYYSGHGIHFQGMQWLVPSKAKILTNTHVLF